MDLFAELFQLFHRRRAVNIRRDEQGGATLFQEQLRKLGAGSGFSGAMQSHHQQAAGIAGGLECGIARAEQIHQLIVNDFDDLLAGLDALDNFLAERFNLHPLDKIAGHLEIDVGFQKRLAHFAQRVARVFLGDFPQSAEVPERILQLAA